MYYYVLCLEMSKVLQFSDSLLMYGKAKVAAQSDNFTQTGMVRSKTDVSMEVERCGVQDKLCKHSMGMDFNSIKYRVFIWNLGKLTVYYRWLYSLIWAKT